MINIENDLKFDRYGDISFIGNDLDVLVYAEDIMYQNIVDRLITNFNDYPLIPNSGANLSSCIGRTNNAELESDIKDKIVDSLTRDNFLSSNELSVITLQNNDEIYLRVTVFGNQGYSLVERFKVNAIYNTSSGFLHATN
jgi:hypothetical protein